MLYQNKFPKIIHQIWLQGENMIPSKFFNYINKIKNLHPNWEYKFWDDAAIIKLLRRNNLWIETYYKLTYLHLKVDYARYIILYVYGGVYIDMDVDVLKPLDTLIYSNIGYYLVVSKLGLNTMESFINCGQKICINNAIIISVPKEKTIGKIIDYVNKNSEKYLSYPKFLCINNTTGPKIFTKIILENYYNGIKILEPEYLEPKILGIGDITNNTYAIHHQNGSWINKNIRSIGKKYFKNKVVFIVVSIIVSIIVFILIIYLLKNKYFNKKIIRISNYNI